MDIGEFMQQDSRKKEDGKMHVCDKRDRAIACMFCCDSV